MSITSPTPPGRSRIQITSFVDATSARKFRDTDEGEPTFKLPPLHISDAFAQGLTIVALIYPFLILPFLLRKYGVIKF